MEYCAAVRMNELKVQATIWINLMNIMVEQKKPDTKGYILYNSIHKYPKPATLRYTVRGQNSGTLDEGTVTERAGGSRRSSLVLMVFCFSICVLVTLV